MKSEVTGKKSQSIYLIIAFLLLYFMAARTPIDPDLWWHLRAGEETLKSGFPMIQDSFSFTRSGAEWTNHSWLSQVLLFTVYSNNGFTGLSILMAVCAVASMWLVSRQMSGSTILKMLLLVFGGIVASVNWVPRPQIISLVLLALTGLLLARYQRKPDRWIWLFPVVMMGWGNLHGGYALGLLLAGCVIGGSVLAHVFGREPVLRWRDVGRLILVILISYLATAINPNGLNTLLIPFQTIGVEGLQNFISEWASPDFHEPLTQVFLVYFLALVWMMVMARRRVTLVELVTVTLFGYMAFTARRNFGPFVLVSLPVFSAQLSAIQIPDSITNWLNRVRAKVSGPSSFSDLSRTSTNAMILFLLVIAAVMKTIVVTQPDFIQVSIRQMYPLTAVEWMQEHLQPARMISDYNWGGFLLWFQPESPVFIDGRTDLYGDEIMGEWLEVAQCGENASEILQKWECAGTVVPS